MSGAAPDNNSTRTLLYTVYFIYFSCGMALCLEGAFNPELKEYYHLDYQQQQYTMFAKNIPFALAVLIGVCIPRLGYKNCLTIAMALFAAGTLLLIPALQSGHYAVVLGAFFIIGLGFNFELVAGNPLLSGLGPPESSASRLNLGNALGAIAQIIAPFILTLIIPATTVTAAGKLPYMKGLFLALGVILLITMVATLFARTVDITASLSAHEATRTANEQERPIWLRPRVVFGFVTIFLVLGAEAGLFGLFRNFVEDPAVAGKSSHTSQQLFTVYFAVFALGRLAGSWAQKRVKAAYTLAINSAAALGLVGMVIVTKGSLAMGSLMLLGFFVSIFFPTLYALAIEGLGSQTAKASGLLTMGFLGCAFLPVLQGRLADSMGLQRSFSLCFVPYLLALCYALSVIKSSRRATKIVSTAPIEPGPQEIVQ